MAQTEQDLGSAGGGVLNALLRLLLSLFRQFQQVGGERTGPA